MSDEAIIETVSLRKDFGGVHAIDDVDFRLAPGELRCLVGPNGAGKSTFFKMLSAQYTPTSGQVLLNGRDVTRASPHEVSRMGVGIKNQVPDVFDNISVSESIWLAARVRNSNKKSRQNTDEVLQQLKLTDLAKDHVGALAHGQRQWVELAMVLASEPQLILLDEPTAGMSSAETARTAELILEANKKAAIIVVEHDMNFIQRIAKMVTVFHQGRILVEDTLSNIKENQMVRDIYLGKSAHA